LPGKEISTRTQSEAEILPCSGGDNFSHLTSGKDIYLLKY